MPIHHRSRLLVRPSLPFLLLGLLLSVLWIAGGASRADAAGQIVVRAASAILLVVAILFGDRPDMGGAKPVLLILAAAILLGLLQLVPLPPTLWQALPGRAMLAEAAAASGQAQPWRPWSITPGATTNSVASLIVPMTALLLVTGSTAEEQSRLPGLLLCLITASTLVGLLQFSGVGVGNPLINDAPGAVSGTFANRNHFALFLALGCLLVPGWIFCGGRRPHWRGPVGLGLVLLFSLTILATGSRAGMVVGLLALIIGGVLAHRGVEAELRRYPRWVSPALMAAVAGVIAVFVLISVAADRAASFDRILLVDPGQDMRSRGLPTVLAIIRNYFPAGSGLGGFDPIFRMHEPFGLLKPTYFNHAHNDFLEVALDAGLPGLILLLSGLTWWAWSTVRAWSGRPDVRREFPRLGSAILLLVVIASAFDYPARTPLIMTVMVIAGIWLGGAAGQRPTSALPNTGQHL